MIIRTKYNLLATSVLIFFLILFFLKSNIIISKLFFSSTSSLPSISNEDFNCETWKKFSYINVKKYETCLTWKRNDAFWSVSDLRHTSFKNFLNSSSLIIEVGGNTGEDTSRFIELYNSSIISFEPLVNMAKDLVEKFKTNPKIEIQPYGLGNRARNISIELSGSNNVGTSIFRKVSNINSTKLQQIQILNIVDVIDNIRKTKTQNGIIDMISINCEGCEFEILPALIQNNLTKYFRIIQFGTHINILAQSSCIYCQIEQALERTHRIIYYYSMLWEAWVLKNEIKN